jgi:hypothetical protein
MAEKIRAAGRPTAKNTFGFLAEGKPPARRMVTADF